VRISSRRFRLFAKQLYQAFDRSAKPSFSESRHGLLLAASYHDLTTGTYGEWRNHNPESFSAGKQTFFARTPFGTELEQTAALPSRIQ